MNTLYEQQFENMQRMNQKWLDVFSKAWEQKQNQKALNDLFMLFTNTNLASPEFLQIIFVNDYC
jgi:hypothetical protein